MDVRSFKRLGCCSDIATALAAACSLVSEASSVSAAVLT